jgi:capsular polysaccharide biosynthesis protein
MKEFFILLAMIFFHIVDDYYLQGWLASAKQRMWWKNNAPDKMYEDDYIMALFMHSFSWTFMIMLVPILLNINNLSILYVFAFGINLLIHAVVDHAKANLKILNLIQDQLIHLFQIYVTWLIFVVL